MESIWSKRCTLPERPALPGNLETEIAVIGAGMAGVLIASALQEAGRRVVVLEAGRTGSGQTCGTTAKLTTQHGLIYHKLIERLGAEKAEQYALANQAALKEYHQLITGRGINCNYTPCGACLCAPEEELEQELQAARRLGLAADFTRDLPAFLPASAAVRFSGQARFHPLKFLGAMAEGLTSHENTPVRRVGGNLLDTPHGTVKAGAVVFACHYPFVNFPGMYFARMHQERAYLLALEHAPALEDVYFCPGLEGYTLRSAGRWLLLGGGSHRTGENSAGGRYEGLRQRAKEWFPGCREAAHWSAQDCMTPDEVPFIGPFAPSRPDWYVATGFCKWGMTTSMAAAMLLRDQICGIENPWAPVFDPARFEAGEISEMASQGGQAVKGLVRRLFQLPDGAAAEIHPGQGGIVLLDGEKVGVYKDEEGVLYPVDIRCPHLGCQLEWNPDEGSWDCPCHGSRFDRFGHLISGPAQEEICHDGNEE